jgi:uncharacterized protein (TIGR03382 family)
MTSSRAISTVTIVTAGLAILLGAFAASSLHAYHTDTSGDPLAGLALGLAWVAGVPAALGLALAGTGWLLRRRAAQAAQGLAATGLFVVSAPVLLWLVLMLSAVG